MVNFKWKPETIIAYNVKQFDLFKKKKGTWYSPSYTSGVHIHTLPFLWPMVNLPTSVSNLFPEAS